MGDLDIVTETRVARRGFAAIAFWQFASFFMLLLVVWVNGVLDLPSILYGTAQRPLDVFGCAVLSAGVMVTAIVTVGHTYIRERRLAASFVTVCSACHRVRIKQELWQDLEKYISSRSEVMISHGLCPDCYGRQVADLAAQPS